MTEQRDKRMNNRLVGFIIAAGLVLPLHGAEALAIPQVAAPTRGQGQTFTVSKTADTADGTCDADCSLREAIITANGTAAADTIELPGGTYTLSLQPDMVAPDEEHGDLDITASLTILGIGPGPVTLDGDFSFRVLHIHSGSVRLERLNVMNGRSLFDDAARMGEGPQAQAGGLVEDFFGGGILMQPMTNLELDSCTLANNRTDRIFAAGALDGGGIYVGEGASLDAINSTFNDNLAILIPLPLPGVFFPNAIHLASLATANLESCTLVDDWPVSASLPADIIVGDAGSTLTLRGSLLRSNCLGDTMTRISLGGNMETPGDTCGLDQPTDMANVDQADLLLGFLADNSGPTLTRALMPGSIALDAGAATCPATDQRGLSRPEDGDGDGTAACDPGAFELRTAPLGAFFFDGFETGDFARWGSTEP